MAADRTAIAAWLMRREGCCTAGAAHHLDARVPGLVAEAAEGEEALGALRAVLGILQAGAAAARAEHHVRHPLQALHQLQLLPAA